MIDMVSYRKTKQKNTIAFTSCKNRMLFEQKLKVTQGHTSSRGIIVNPEGDPGQDCDQDGGHVSLQDKIAYVSFDAETQRQPRV